MTFAWPWALLSLLVIPLLVGLRWLLRRRRRRAVVTVTSMALVRAALPARSSWRRRLPVALLLAGLAVLGVGAARPQASVPVGSNSTTILLALDVSGSMCSTDVDPNRLTAARLAASDFVQSHGTGARLGLVTFAGSAGLVVPPTEDTEPLLEALTDLTTARGTAIGQAILASIDAIAEVDPAVAPTGANPNTDDDQTGYAADVIVLLTDGANTHGTDPQVAAREAAERRVRVFTIGFGTTTPSPRLCEGRMDYGSRTWGGGGRWDGTNNPLLIDEVELRQIADVTGGIYYRAENAGQLTDALRELPGTLTTIRQNIDVAAWFAAAGGVLVAAAAGLSLWWGTPRRRAVAGSDDAGRHQGAGPSQWPFVRNRHK
jgi:Ca-activated chloride channel family protein